MQRQSHEYGGWRIRYRPVGAMFWQAEWRGVTMCARTLDGLKRMIDVRNHEAREERRARENG